MITRHVWGTARDGRRILGFFTFSDGMVTVTVPGYPGRKVAQASDLTNAHVLAMSMVRELVEDVEAKPQ